jgi:hypothetical protein
LLDCFVAPTPPDGRTRPPGDTGSLAIVRSVLPTLPLEPVMDSGAKFD